MSVSSSCFLLEPRGGILHFLVAGSRGALFSFYGLELSFNR